jgi:hypothetical protein
MRETARAGSRSQIEKAGSRARTDDLLITNPAISLGHFMSTEKNTATDRPPQSLIAAKIEPFWQYLAMNRSVRSSGHVEQVEHAPREFSSTRIISDLDAGSRSCTVNREQTPGERFSLSSQPEGEGHRA